MGFDRPPRITQRRTSLSWGGVSLSPKIIVRRMVSLSSDKTPIPSKGCRLIPEAEDCTHTNETESSSDVFQIPSEDDEKSVDHSIICSEASATEHSEILDSSSFVKSEARGPLHEEQHKSLSFEIAGRRKLLRSSSSDRAIFETEGHDIPPQLATRLHSSFGSTEEDSEPIVNDRFGNNVPRGKDERLSFKIAGRRKLLRSSSSDRAIFEIEGHDIPPQLAKRLHSSFGSTEEDSEPIVNDRFGNDVPREKDNKPKPLPRRLSLSTHVTMAGPCSAGPCSAGPCSALPKLAEAFRSGCITRTHTYHLKKYANTFVGSEAVDYMLSAKLASTREDAVFLGQRFCNELNLFHHINWDHTFKDGNYLYLFSDESATQLSKEDLVRSTEKFVEGILLLSKRMRRRRLKKYKNTFLGEEAVNYMLQENLVSTRPGAVFLGQRMMEELNIFEPVAHNSRFKDSCYLYRLTTENRKSLCFYESAEIMSLMESIDSQHHQYSPLSPLAPITGRRAKLRSVLSSRTICGPRKKSKVSFGSVQVRCFERSLDCNPATDSGPSLGLGWRFYDDSPLPLGDENSGVLELRGRGRLSVQDRTYILKEWGYNKKDISKATRVNKKVRRQRRSSLNN